MGCVILLYFRSLVEIIEYGKWCIFYRLVVLMGRGVCVIKWKIFYVNFEMGFVIFFVNKLLLFKFYVL